MKLNHSIKTGFSFGITSGVITTLGLMVGLNSSTHSKSAVIGGILIIAIADAFSDALGIHMSEESENKHHEKEIWQSTCATFIAKFMVASSFIIPILIFRLDSAVILSVIYGMALLGIFSYYIAKEGKENKAKIITEHILIAIIVVMLTNCLGDFVRKMFS